MRFGLKEPVAKRGVGILRDIIAMSKTGEVLHQIPDRLASIIERYDNLNIDPNFRGDIYNILSSSIDIAESLVDPTFPFEVASEQISKQMEVLSRILRFLNQRPSRVGYSILIPNNQMLIGQFGTVEEAESHLGNLSALGAVQHAVVVPVKVMSQHVVQPKQDMRIGHPATLQGPIPAGIIPSQPTPQRAVELTDKAGDDDTFWDQAQAALAEKKEVPKPPPLPSNNPPSPPVPAIKPNLDVKPSGMQDRLKTLEQDSEALIKSKSSER